MNIDISQKYVFVVEDDLDNLRITETLLKREVGIQRYNSRASGRYLFQWVDANPSVTIDLILLDLQIPREDGYSIQRQIRSHDRLHDTLVVALTANVMEQDVRRCRDAGFDGFIGKPVMPERFPEQIRRILLGEPVWEPR